MIDEKLRNMLAESRLLSLVYGGNVNVSENRLEPDRRKQKKVVKELLEEGYLVKEAGTPLRITDMATSEIPLDYVNLIGIWEEKHVRDGAFDLFRAWPFVRIGDYSLKELKPWHLKNILESPQDYKFYLADSWTLDHNGRYEEKLLEGPYTLQEAQEAWGKETGSRGRDKEIVVSHGALREHVANKVFEARLEESYQKNLPWGLVKLGIITEEESDRLRSGDGLDTCGLFLGSHTIRTGEPEKWEQSVEKGIDAHIEKLSELQKNLQLLQKIRTGMAAYGGWALFKENYRQALRAALLKKVEKEAV